MKLRLPHCTVATVCIKCSGALGHLSTGQVDKILIKLTSKAGKSLFQSGIEPRTVCEIYANLCQDILCPPSLQFRRDTRRHGAWALAKRNEVVEWSGAEWSGVQWSGKSLNRVACETQISKIDIRHSRRGRQKPLENYSFQFAREL
ncbi:uncharacterized protein LOC116800924 [Drosophila sechellia]|uniref:uncharacterized protein LOC116800924 n=1 Tax=Drosophila sechellia TaxID=7238 RepID=UPI0013DDC03C|nr:uncharacterized protein LOC116800924 [Drosophila sechellia]